MTHATTDTSRAAYADTRATGTDVSLREQIAASLKANPATTHELGERFPERSANAIRPRVNELLRMKCIERRGTRENPSGHAAAVHHLTDLGRAYLRGEADPEPGPTLAERKSDVLRVARAYVEGRCDRDVLRCAVESYDAAAERMGGDS